jgi:hypothetical protein
MHTQIGIWGLKIYHLAYLVSARLWKQFCHSLFAQGWPALAVASRDVLHLGVELVQLEKWFRWGPMLQMINVFSNFR